MISETTVLPFAVAGQKSAFSQKFGIGSGIAEPGIAEPLEFRERRFVPWLMVLVDAVVAQFALALGLLARHIASPWLPNTFGPETYRGIVVGLLALPLANWLMGLYPGYGVGPVERLRRRLVAPIITFTALIVWNNLVLDGEWSRAIQLFTFAFALVLSPFVEVILVTILMRRGWWGTPVIVLSSDNAGSRIVESLTRKRELGLVPIGLLKNRPETWGETISGVPVLGPTSLAAGLAAYARTAVVAMPSYHSPQLAALVETLPFPSIVLVPDLPGVQSLWITPRDMGGAVGLELRRNLQVKRNYYCKRALDYVVGVPLFLVSVPIIAVLALWIKRVSPGPAFYTQEREGYRGGKIRVWKLRTMYTDAEQMLKTHLDKNPAEREHWQRFFKLKHDVRILPGVGRLLRRTSLDELPQFWNVMKGELSLVGPRPFPEYHLEEFGSEFRELRSSVPPGVTGFWQVSERSDADLKGQEKLDTYYIRNWSLWLDLYILTRTLGAVIMPKGAY